MWIVFIWFGVWMSGGYCETIMNSGFYKAWNVSYLNNQLLMSEEWLSSIQLVHKLVFLIDIIPFELQVKYTFAADRYK